jgi:hypothetical protein
MSVLTKPMLTALLGLMAALTATLPAHAQIFRIVGPDGKVTFSDKPPSYQRVQSCSVCCGTQWCGGGHRRVTALCIASGYRQVPCSALYQRQMRAL